MTFNNCVENEQLDVRYAEDNGTVYDNAHHGLLMMLLARAKLGDVFRKVHGPTATCYTIPAVLFRVGRAHPEGLFEKKEKLLPNSVQNIKNKKIDQ